MTAAKWGNDRGFFLPCLSQPIRSVRYRSATQVGYFQQAQHTRVAQFVSLEVTDSTYESIYLVAFILAGPVYNNELKNRAALLCRTQRRVARMCSSNLSVNCEYVAKQTLR